MDGVIADEGAFFGGGEFAEMGAGIGEEGGLDEDVVVAAGDVDRDDAWR
jgi:hypothetical protein